MNSVTMARVLALIPERTVRVSSGTLFLPAGTSCAQPERFALVQRFLHWMSPLAALSRDEQRELGLVSGTGRPADAAGAGEEAETESEGEEWELA
jgi:hypothetical protein